MPIVIFTDPALSQTFGRLDYSDMKAQKYAEIFKTARDGIRKAQKEGTFLNGGKAPEIVKVENTPVEVWKSAAGTEIKARLTGIEDDSTYLFETEDGKTIRATAEQLDKESVARARQLAKVED